MSGDENMPPPGPEQLSATKKTKDLSVELVEHVGPPRECPIKLKEWPWPNPIEMNWIAICGDLEEEKRLLYLEEVGRSAKQLLRSIGPTQSRMKVLAAWSSGRRTSKRPNGKKPQCYNPLRL